MPDYFSEILLVFILASCFYKKHIFDWWWFQVGLISYLAAIGLLTAATLMGNVFSPMRALGYYGGQIGLAVAFAGFLVACFKRARAHVGELRCLNCDYVLKGLTEPRCPECGWKI